MEVLLTIYSDEKEYFAREVSLPCVIGRGKQCDVTIVHPLVSRRHCEIYEENGVVMVRDLGSLNGTFFNGGRIGRGIALPSGGSFSIGRLMLRASIPGGVIADEPESAAGAEKHFLPPLEESSNEPASGSADLDVVDDVEILDDNLLDDAQSPSQAGGESSIIDLDSYLKNQ